VPALQRVRSDFYGVLPAAAYQSDEEQRCPHYGEFCTASNIEKALIVVISTPFHTQFLAKCRIFGRRF
jgi:hypothetical protein